MDAAAKTAYDTAETAKAAAAVAFDASLRTAAGYADLTTAQAAAWDTAHLTWSKAWLAACKTCPECTGCLYADRVREGTVTA